MSIPCGLGLSNGTYYMPRIRSFSRDSSHHICRWSALQPDMRITYEVHLDLTLQICSENRSVDTSTFFAMEMIICTHTQWKWEFVFSYYIPPFHPRLKHSLQCLISLLCHTNTEPCCCSAVPVQRRMMARCEGLDRRFDEDPIHCQLPATELIRSCSSLRTSETWNWGPFPLRKLV